MKGVASHNPNRNRVIAHVQANPGGCLQELSDEIGLTRTAVAHHVRALEKAGMLALVRQGRRILIFPREVQRSTERSILGLLRQASARQLMQLLFADPKQSWRQLAARLDMTPHSVRWHIARLTQQGLIHVVPDGLGSRGHTVHFHPTLRASLGAMAQARVDLADKVIPAPDRFPASDSSPDGSELQPVTFGPAQ